MLIPHQKLTVRPSDVLRAASGFPRGLSLSDFPELIPLKNPCWAGSARAALKQVLEKNKAKTVALSTPFTCHVVADAITAAGAKLVFGKREQAKADALIAPYNYGFMPDVMALKDYCDDNGVLFIEDCAQALGARYEGRPAGSFGDCAVFSFGISKNAGFMGGATGFEDCECGGVNRKERFPALSLLKLVAEAFAAPLFFSPRIYSRKLIEAELSERSRKHEMLDYGMPDFGKRVVLSMLSRYEEILKTRKENAELCMRGLEGVCDFVRPVKKCDPAWLYFVLKTGSAAKSSEFRKKLYAEGIDVQPLLTFSDLSGGSEGSDHLCFAMYRPRRETEKFVEAVRKAFSK